MIIKNQKVKSYSNNNISESNNVQSENNRNSRYMMRKNLMNSIYEVAKVDQQHRSDFKIIIDTYLEDLLLSNKKGLLIELIKNETKNILENPICNENEISHLLIDYIRTEKLGLLIARDNGSLDSVFKKEFIIQQFVLAYSRYLGAYDKYISLDISKSYITKKLQEMKIEITDKKIFNFMKYYYHKYKRNINAIDFLKKNVERNFNISMLLAENLIKRNQVEINAQELLQVEPTKLLNVEDTMEGKTVSIPKNDNKEHEKLVEELAKLTENIEIERIMYEQEKKKMLDEIQTLRKEKLENIEFAKSQYKKAINDVIKGINSKNYGYILDEFYRYSKGYINEINFRAIISNLISALQSLGIMSIEKNSIGEKIAIESNSVYKFRFNRPLKNVDKEGIVNSPSWFYENEELIQQLIEIKED